MATMTTQPPLLDSSRAQPVSGLQYDPSGSRNVGQDAGRGFNPIGNSASSRDAQIAASHLSRATDFASGLQSPIGVNGAMSGPPQPQPGVPSSFGPLRRTDTLQDMQMQGIPPFPGLNPEMFKDLPNAPDPRDKQVMYRVRGIPHRLPPEAIKQFLLDELFPGNKRVKVEGEPKIIQGEGKDVEQDTQIALIQFTEKPEAFSKKSIYFLQCWRGASIDNTFYGFTTLFSGRGEKIIADIIAVTGLSAHAYGSWKGRDGHKEMWLHDFLPDKFPDCRIMIHGYESDIVKSTGINRLEDYVNEFLNELDKKRPTPEEKQRPIIFIGHSLGGLIVTHAIVNSSRSAPSHALLPLTKAIIFFGTPHRGLGEHAKNILDVVGENLTRPALVKSLQVGSRELNVALRSFINLLSENGPKIITFYEQKETFALERDKNGKPIRPKGGRSYVALEPEAAWVGVPWERRIPVDKDHSEMVKFDSMYDRTFETLHHHMREVIYSEAEKCICKTLECAINHGNTERLQNIYKSQLDGKKTRQLDRGRISKPLLHHAVESGTLEVLRTLVGLGITLCEKDGIHGNTALHYAISEGRHDMAVELAQRTETHWIRNNYDCTPLDMAVMLHKLDIVQLMLNLMFEGETFIRRAEAMSQGREEINRADQNGTVVLHRAAMTGDYRVVRRLLDSGAMVDVKDFTGTSALHLAAISGNPEIVKGLLDMGAMVDTKERSGFTPLHLAVLYDNRQAAEVLLEYKADIEAKGLMGSTPLYAASGSGNPDLTALLIQNDANVNARCDNGCDALFAAATGPEANEIPGPQSVPLDSIMSGFILTVRLLLRNKADVDARNDYGATALRGVFGSLIGFLLGRVGGPNSGDGDNKNEDGVNGGGDNEDEMEQSPYDIEQADNINNLEIYRKDIAACFKGYSMIARVLLNYNADINTRNESWQTPLHAICDGPMIFIKEVSPIGFHPVILESVFEGYKGMLKMMIGRGADVYAQDDVCRTPLDILNESMEKIGDLPPHKLQLLQPSPLFRGVSAALGGMADILKQRAGDITEFDANARIPSPKSTGNPKISNELILRSTIPMGLAKTHSSRDIIERTAVAYPATTDNYHYSATKTPNRGLDIRSNEKNTHLIQSTVGFMNEKQYAGMNTNDEIVDALHMAAVSGDLETTRNILDNKEFRVNLNAQSVSGNTILHSAIEGVHTSVVEALLEKGCSLNTKNKFGDTPLHTAIRSGNDVLVGLLLCNRAYSPARSTAMSPFSSPSLSELCLDIKDRLGNTALHLAVESGNEDILALLLNCKPNLELQRKDRLRALHLAVVRGNEEMVQSLLHHGAKVDQDLQGRQTLLHVAARFGNIRMAKVLCRHDRSLIDAQDDSRATPLDVAARLGNLEMVNMFKGYARVKQGLFSRLVSSVQNLADSWWDESAETYN